MPATIKITPPLPGLSPVNGKAVNARFDGGSLSSDAGLPALREVERRLDVAGRLAACIDDPRYPVRALHSAAGVAGAKRTPAKSTVASTSDRARLHARAGPPRGGRLACMRQLNLRNGLRPSVPLRRGQSCASARPDRTGSSWGARKDSS